MGQSTWGQSPRDSSTAQSSADTTRLQQGFRMKLSVSLTICLCVASTTATIFNSLRSPGQKTKPPKEVGGQSYLSLNPAPAPDSVRLPIGELPLYKQRHLYSSYKLPAGASALRSQPTQPQLQSVGSTFSENAFALEKDTFYPDPEPHVSKNTFVQN